MPQGVQPGAVRPTLTFLAVPVDVDLDAGEGCAAARPDMLEDEMMHAGSSEPDIQHPRRSCAIGMLEIRRAFVDDFNLRVRVDEVPDVTRGGVVLNVDGKQIVRAGFEECLAVGCREGPHVRPGVCGQGRWCQGVLQVLDAYGLESVGLRTGEDIGRDQSPARSFVADAQAKCELVDVGGLMELVLGPS